MNNFFGFAKENDCSLHKNKGGVNCPDTPGKIVLENALCVILPDWRHFSISHLTREEKLVKLKELGFSDEAIANKFI